MPVQQIMIWALQCQHDLDVHLLFCVDIDLHITSSVGRVQLGLFRRSSLMGTTLRAAPSKSYAFSTIIMHKLHYQHEIDVHLLFCFDLDLPITAPEVMFNLDFISVILTDGYHFVCSTQQKLCIFNKLLCMHCITNIG